MTAPTPDATWECKECCNQFDAAVRPKVCPGCGEPGSELIRTDNGLDPCMCGHAREEHDRRGCDTVIRNDGLSCPCRGFRRFHPRERGEDDGVEYADPRDARSDA